MSKRDEVLSSTTDEPKPKKDIATHSVQTADFSWSAPLRHGDCKLSGFLNGTLNNGPTLRLRSDGTAELLSKFFSTDSGDVWVIDRLVLLDIHGTVLFTFPHLSSPATQTDNQVIDWVAQISFPAVFFSSVTGASMSYRC
jgi:Family of unknown function (DUF6294)